MCPALERSEPAPPALPALTHVYFDGADGVTCFFDGPVTWVDDMSTPGLLIGGRAPASAAQYDTNAISCFFANAPPPIFIGAAWSLVASPSWVLEGVTAPNEGYVEDWPP